MFGDSAEEEYANHWTNSRTMQGNQHLTTTRYNINNRRSVVCSKSRPNGDYSSSNGGGGYGGINSIAILESS